MAELTEDSKTIADLQKQVETLTADKKAATEQIATLKTDLGLARDQAQKATIAKEAAEKQNTEALAIVTDLKSQLAEKQAGSVDLPMVKIGADHYELHGGSFMFEGVEVSLGKLKEDPKLAAKLLKERVGNLRKLDK